MLQIDVAIVAWTLQQDKGDLSSPLCGMRRLIRTAGAFDLGLDSLGMERRTAFGSEKLLQILTYRLHRELRTIITLNTPLSELPPAIQVMLRDSNLCEYVLINVRDYRRISLIDRAR